MVTARRFLVRALGACIFVLFLPVDVDAQGLRVGVPVRGPGRRTESINPKFPFLEAEGEESDEAEEGGDGNETLAEREQREAQEKEDREKQDLEEAREAREERAEERADGCDDASDEGCDACACESCADDACGGDESSSDPERHKRGKISYVDPNLIWPWWWEHNKDRFLARASARGRVRPGSAYYWFGAGPKHTPRNIEPVPDSVRAGRVLAVLSRALRDRNSAVRAEACIALGRIGPIPVTAADRRAGLSDDHVVRQLVAVLAANRSRTPAAREVRKSAILGLGICGSEAAAAALRARFADSPHWERAYVCIALGLARDRESIRLLASRLPHSNRRPPREDQLAAIHAFGLLGPDAVDHPESSRLKIVPRLVKLANPSGRDDVAMQAVSALARMGVELRTVKRACSARNPNLRWTAVLALKHFTGGAKEKEQTAGALMSKRGMRSSDAQMKNFAILTAGDMCGGLHRMDPVRRKMLLPALRQHLGKVDVQAQSAAVLALGLAGDRDSIPRIAELLAGTSDSNIAGAACLALGLMKATKHSALVRERVVSSARFTPDARGYAALGLALMGDTTHRSELRSMHKRSDIRFGTQRNLPLAVGVLGDRGTNDHLIAMFSKESRARRLYVSSSAAFAMSCIRDLGAVTELADLVEKSPSAAVRGMAVIALGYTASLDPVSRLTRCFTNVSYRNGYRWRTLYAISMIL